MKPYNIVYGVAHSHYQKVWKGNKNMVDFNVSLGLSVSLLSFLACIVLIFELIGSDFLMPLFTNMAYLLTLCGAILLLHHFRFDHKQRSDKIVLSYNKSKKSIKGYKIFLINLYLFGSPICTVILGILAAFKNQ